MQSDQVCPASEKKCTKLDCQVQWDQHLPTARRTPQTHAYDHVNGSLVSLLTASPLRQLCLARVKEPSRRARRTVELTSPWCFSTPRQVRNTHKFSLHSRVAYDPPVTIYMGRDKIESKYDSTDTNRRRSDPAWVSRGTYSCR